MLGVILFRIKRSYILYVWHRRDIVLPWFQYGDALRFPPYCWSIVMCKAIIEHCKQPLVSFVTNNL